MPLETDPLALLDQAIEAQQAHMRGYEIESEALTLETVRALDYVHFKDLLPGLKDRQYPSAQEISIMQRGINEALSRVLPKTLKKDTFKIYKTSSAVKEKADNFIFDAGLLAMAKRQRSLLAQGFLRGYVDPRPTPNFRILVLDVVDSSAYWDAIGRESMTWISAQTMRTDRGRESELERRYMELLPQLSDQLSEPNSWQTTNAFEGSDLHFHEWAQLYLRRMAYQDLLAEGDVIGGYPYTRYVEVLTVISAICQMRICHAHLLHSNFPATEIREILTGSFPLDELRHSVATFLDADIQEVSKLLEYITLSPENQAHHLSTGTPAWAPIIRTSENSCVLPSYGLDINPFVFLAHELRTRHEKDWSHLANRREGRWVQELEMLFPAPRWKCVDGTLLKRASSVVTDIDFVAYDTHTRQLALFQLKWQQPALANEKMLRSNGTNLIKTGNQWVQDVSNWLTEFGARELMQRAGFGSIVPDQFALFMVARYSAHMPGQTSTDSRASWSDWGHLCKHRDARPNGSVLDLDQDLRSEMEKTRAELGLESIGLPLPGLALIVNPIQRPSGHEPRT